MNGKLIWSVLLLLAIAGPQAVAGSEMEANLQRSIVKIYTVANRPDYARPWQMHGQQACTGSGCIIEGKRVLTNAHVVADQTFVQVKRAGEARKYVARPEIVGHESDLAILNVEDDRFFQDVEPLEFGELPRIRDQVAVYGFPQGGTKLAITEGVVSRVENLTYSHSWASLLCCQIDAAINPGSSGGPVIADNKIVGVAFQGMQSGQSIGYMVPPPVIRHFFEDIDDGEHDGHPTLAVAIETLENPDIRAHYGMKEDQTGVLVTKVHHGSSAEGVLEEYDVLLELGGYEIENDATVEFRENSRTSMAYAIEQFQIGETMEARILRDGEQMTVRIPLEVAINQWQIVPRRQYETTPTYYIVGGLVFSPLTFDLLKEKGGALPRSLHNYYYADSFEDRDQIVAIIQVLSDEVNVGYQAWKFGAVEKVNGVEITGIQDLVRAIETNQDAYHRVSTEEDQVVILSREKCRESESRILERYKIPNDRSEDLKGLDFDSESGEDDQTDDRGEADEDEAESDED